MIARSMQELQARRHQTPSVVYSPLPFCSLAPDLRQRKGGEVRWRETRKYRGVRKKTKTEKEGRKGDIKKKEKGRRESYHLLPFTFYYVAISSLLLFFPLFLFSTFIVRTGINVKSLFYITYD
jgi:hypothetical protein